MLRACATITDLSNIPIVMQSPRRIAVVSLHTCPWQCPGNADAGGMNVYVRETVKTLAVRGWLVDIFTRNHGGASETVEQPVPGVRLIHVSAGPVDFAKDELHHQLSAFTSGVLAHVSAVPGGYEAVVSHYWLSGLAAIGLQTAAPHVAAFHTLSLAKENAFPQETATPERLRGERQVVGSAHRLLANSDHERSALIELYGADADRISIACPGVDRSCFHPRKQLEVRRRLGLTERGRIVLAVGRATAIKGFEVLVKAMARVSDPSVTVIFIGEGSNSGSLDGLRSLTRRLGLHRRIRFIGSVSHQAMPEYFAACDLVAVPSYYESFGMVALEAMACGRPVIATRVGGLQSLVRDGIDGWLVPPGSVNHLADSIQAFFSGTKTLRPDAESNRHVRGGWRATTDALIRASEGVV